MPKISTNLRYVPRLSDDEIHGLIGFAYLDGLTPLRGGSGFGRETTLGFSPPDRCAVGRSDKLGETAVFDGREVIGALAVSGGRATAVAKTRTKLARVLVNRSPSASATLLRPVSSRFVIVRASRWDRMAISARSWAAQPRPTFKAVPGAETRSGELL